MPWQKISLLVIAPLALGTLVYWTIRGHNPPPFLQWLHLPPSPVDLSPWLPVFLQNALPSACWTFALAAALLLLWQTSRTTLRWALGSIALGVSVLFELLQMTGTFPGTFDWQDIGLSAMAAALAVFVCKTKST